MASLGVIVVRLFVLPRPAHCEQLGSHSLDMHVISVCTNYSYMFCIHLFTSSCAGMLRGSTLLHCHISQMHPLNCRLCYRTAHT